MRSKGARAPSCSPGLQAPMGAGWDGVVALGTSGYEENMKGERVMPPRGGGPAQLAMGMGVIGQRQSGVQP